MISYKKRAKNYSDGERGEKYMRNKRKIIIIVVIILLVCGAIGWRVWPHTFDTVLSVDQESVTSMACTATVYKWEDGAPVNELYELQPLLAEDDSFADIMDILGSTEYRRDFRNLFPSSDVMTEVHEDSVVSLYLIWGDSEEQSCFLSFHNGDTLVASVGTQNGYCIYHPLDKEVLNEVSAYIQEHGDKK